MGEKQMKEIIQLSDLDWDKTSTNERHNSIKRVSFNKGQLTLSNNNHDSVTFEQGISIEAEEEVIYDLSHLNYNYLTTWVGVDRQLAHSDTSLLFEIYADDELKYKSKVMGFKTPMEYVTINISNTNTLKLVVTTDTDISEPGYGDWADIKLHLENPITRNIKQVKQYDGMKLIFNEDFDGETINNEWWNYGIGPENGTHHYANTPGKGENIWVEDGNLVIQAKPFKGEADYKTTSALVNTRDKFSFKYGRIDVRAKLPTETGMWPAIWMMPVDQTNSWPMEGEIDIMELVSQTPNRIFATLHSGVFDLSEEDIANYLKEADSIGIDQASFLERIPHLFKAGDSIAIDQGTFFDDYHVYSMIWKPEQIKFYVDDTLIHTCSDWKNWYINDEEEIVERPFPKPFDQPFYIKLNLATGGDWAEDVDETTRFGERTTMLIDYVRVYQNENRFDY